MGDKKCLIKEGKKKKRKRKKMVETNEK